MLFNSLHFILFFPTVVAIYFAIPHRYRWTLLLMASYYFYMCWKAEYLILIIISTLVDYFAGIQMARQTVKRKRTKYLILSLISNFGLLFFFKYFNFFNNSLYILLKKVNIFYDVPYFDVLLPVGISFYTFQTLSYTIDMYTGKRKPETHLGIFALYVAFFPQLVAGPIERSTRLIPQLKRQQGFDYQNISKGIKLIIWGYFLKLVIADRAAIYVDFVYNYPENHSGLTFILATILFAFQIYGDFAGYSSIAIGTAKIMGYDLMTNFNRPYLAFNIQNFWKRWHISLSTWFRDYLYIPLGGNRVVKWRWYFNLFITFLISGLWHGANWTFVLWGALHGGYIICSNIKKSLLEKYGFTFEYQGYRKIVRIGMTFILVSFAWIFFRANTVGEAFFIVQKILFSPGNVFLGGDKDTLVAPIYAMVSIIILVIIELKQEFFPDLVFTDRNGFINMVAYALLITMIVYVGVFDSRQFIYFQF